MSRLKEKLKNVKQAQANVKEIRRALTARRLDFQCKERDQNDRVVINENFFGAHDVSQNYAMPMPCMILHDYEYCPNVNCPNIPWNKKYVGLNIQLRDAKHERNQAILDLLHLKEKVADIKEYRRLKKLKKQQSKEVLHVLVEYDLAAQGAYDEDNVEKVKGNYETALEKYKETEKEFNIARRKLWGRSK
ncbi:MAG: hypothetical protein J5613_00955 [Alphaproteobacteria bacterium]|nr:hypothetical protein [Alphaproteobacteria bacterium]